MFSSRCQSRRCLRTGSAGVPTRWHSVAQERGATMRWRHPSPDGALLGKCPCYFHQRGHAGGFQGALTTLLSRRRLSCAAVITRPSSRAQRSDRSNIKDAATCSQGKGQQDRWTVAFRGNFLSQLTTALDCSGAAPLIPLPACLPGPSPTFSMRQAVSSLQGAHDTPGTWLSAAAHCWCRRWWP